MQFWRSEAETGLHWARITLKARAAFLMEVLRESVSLTFPVSRGRLLSFLPPSSKPAGEQLSLTLTSASGITSSQTLLPPSFTYQDPRDFLGPAAQGNLPSQEPQFHQTCKFLLPSKVTCSQAPALGQGLFQGGHCSAYHTPFLSTLISNSGKGACGLPDFGCAFPWPSQAGQGQGQVVLTS